VSSRGALPLPVGSAARHARVQRRRAAAARPHTTAAPTQEFYNLLRDNVAPDSLSMYDDRLANNIAAAAVAA
jgi:hypothetical protein